MSAAEIDDAGRPRSMARVPSGRPTRLTYVATDPVTVFRLMDGQLAYMRARGFDVSVVSSPGRLLDRAALREGVAAWPVPMERAIAPRRDAASLVRLTALFRRLRPDIVYAGTPKGGLLGVLAGRLARVPVVVYHLRGLRYSTATGLARAALVGAEHVATGLADWIFCNGESMRRELVTAGFSAHEKTWVPAHGSSNGVDVDRYRPTAERHAWGLAERRRLGIAEDAVVVGFVGRFTRDKGLAELARALDATGRDVSSLHLLAVGDFDRTDPLPAGVVHWLEASDRVTRTGYLEDPAACYAMMDLFAFPSFREGFPNAPLEAAAAELPTVGFRAVGTVDAVVDGTTGALVEVGDVEGLARALVRYARSPELRARHGRAAGERVRALYRREVVWEALAARFEELGAVAAARGTARHA